MVINKTIREEDDVTLSLEPLPKHIFSPAAASIQGFGIHFGKKFGPNRNGRISGNFGPISDSIR